MPTPRPSNTTITFTDADDLGKQVCALERCDTVNTGIWFWTHIDSPAIYIAGEDSITCREVVLVAVTEKSGWQSRYIISTDTLFGNYPSQAVVWTRKVEQ